jgi:hypothetical protein
LRQQKAKTIIAIESDLKQLLKEASKKRSCFILSLHHYKNDAFSSRPERPGYKAKKKNAPSFYFAAIRSFNSIEVPSCRGGRSEAQHNAPRQGSALPSLGVPDHYNVVPPSYWSLLIASANAPSVC